MPFSIVQVQGRLALTDDAGTVLGVFDDSANLRLMVQAQIDLPRLTEEWPEPEARDAGDRGSLTVDWQNRLITRSQVTTDEHNTYRDDFSTPLDTVLTGTVTFTAGKTVTGSGTLFTTELDLDSYIKISTDTGSKYKQVARIISDTSLELTENYTGSTTPGTASAANWRLWPGTGATITQSGTQLQIASGTSTSYSHVIRDFGDGPGVYVANCYLSQRIANQVIAIGFRDPAGNNEALVLFDGTDDTKIKVRTAYHVSDVETTQYTLPAGKTTATIHEYRIAVMHENVRVWVDDLLVATHTIHMPSPYEHMWQGCIIRNTATPSSSTTIYVDSIFVAKKALLEVKLSPALENLRTDGDGNLKVVISSSPLALPLIVNLNYSRSDGAIVAQAFKRVVEYTVPDNYNGWLVRYSSWENEGAESRLVAQTILAQLNCSTNVFTAGTNYVLPAWTPLVEADVTTAFPAGSGNITVTVTYTNELGVGSRTGTFTISKGSAIGTRVILALQTGDLGVRSIENMSASPTYTGVIRALGLIQLAYHNDLSLTTQLETNYQPGAIAFPTGTVLAIEFAGNTVFKDRLFDCLLQLVPVI